MHIAIFGHGGAGGVQIGESVLMSNDILGKGSKKDREKWGGGLDHELTTLFLGGCASCAEGNRDKWLSTSYQFWGSIETQTISEQEMSVDDIVLAPPRNP